MCFDHKKLTQGVLYGLLANAVSLFLFAVLVSQINTSALSILATPDYLLYVLGTTATIALLTMFAETWSHKKTHLLLAGLVVAFVAWVHTMADGRLLFAKDPWLYVYAVAMLGVLYLGSIYYKTDVPQKTILLLSIIGIALSMNLGYIHWKLMYDPNYVSPCTAGESISCDAVNSSEYAEIFGIPVAFLGLAFYVGVMALAWLSTTENRRVYGDMPSHLLFIAGIGGLSFTLYLASIEEFVLGIWCPLCVVSAFLSTIVFLMTTRFIRIEADPKSFIPVRLVQVDEKPSRQKKKPENVKAAKKQKRRRR